MTHGLLEPKNMVIRHTIILLLALVFAANGIYGDPTILRSEITLDLVLRNILSQFIYIAIIWNGNMVLYSLIPMNRFTWEKHTKLLITIAGSIAIIWPTLVHFTYNTFLFPLILQHPCELGSKENMVFLIVAISITLFINSVFIAIEFFNHWKTSLTEKESLKRNSITAEFESLKNQVNPHFLFNSLNTLSGLIEEDPKIATDFVQKLASVYRYVLSHKDKEIVSIGEELAFAESYIYLNKIRFGENLIIDMKVEPSILMNNMATLTLQMLIENAIKHNIISKEKPLTITFQSSNDYLCISNNLQRKTILTESNGIGLTNIKSRYEYLSQLPVLIEETSHTFKVCVPLLPNDLTI